MTELNRDEKAIFLTALDKESPEEQAAFLEQACSGDQQLLARVKELLAAHEGSLGPLDAPPPGVGHGVTVDAPVLESVGTMIGPYKLREKIGEGGMGVVYVAEQKQPVKRRVALKIIKPGMDSQQVIARFEAERQALAMMDHPNIAKVLDAGTTDRGLPYFVMELVNGLPITRYCDEQHLEPRQRLELFIGICQAVQHAHQKGIIHRDLKPSNILVALYDGRPVPKVIDFGVAKATSQTLSEKSVYTQLGQLVGTLEYMSPEQAERNQLDIDTRSDVYSLGVVLYELLTGETPFERKRLRSAAFDEMLRIIREEEPPKPSTKISSSESLPSVAANRHMEPQKLSVLVRGELDWIVMKALEKDRGRRYETANGFANDIKRYLNDEPVVACPPSAAYRFRKFARRNKLAFVTGSLVAAALILGIIGTSWQAIIAQRNFENEKIARLDADDARKQERQARLGADAATKQAQIEREQADNARIKEATARKDAETARDEAQTEATRAKTVVGILTEIFASADYGDEKAKPVDFTMSQMLFHFADRLPKQLENYPEVEADVRSIIGRAFTQYTLLDMADHQISKSHRLRREIYGEHHPEFIDSLLDYHDLHHKYGNTQEAKKLAHQAHTLAQKFPGEVALRLRSLRALMSHEPWRRQIEIGEQALEFARQHEAESNPDVAEVFRIYIGAKRKQANAIAGDSKSEQHAKKLREVEALARRAVDENRARFGNDHFRTGGSLRQLGHILKDQGAIREAELVYREAFEMLAKQNYARRGAILCYDLRPMMDDSQLQELLLKDSQATQYYWGCLAFEQLKDDNIDAFRKTCETMVENYQYPLSFGDYIPEQISLTAFLSPNSLDDWSPAIKLMRRYHAVHTNDSEGYDADFLLGILLFRGGQYDEAIELLSKTERAYATNFPPYLNHTYVVTYQWWTWLFLAMANHKNGNEEEAQRWFGKAAVEIPRLLQGEEFVAGWRRFAVETLRDEAQEMLQIDPADIQPTNAWSFIARAGLYRSRGQIDEAVADFKKAVELDSKSTTAHRRLGALFRTTNRNQDAIVEYEKALELEPENYDIQFECGECLLEINEFSQALERFEQAIKLNPGATHFRKRAALAHFHLEQYEQALADLRVRADDDPDDTSTLVWIDPHLVAKCPDESFKAGLLKLADQLVVKTNGVAGAYARRGLLHLAFEYYNKAIADFTKAIELEPSPGNLMYRAVVYRAMGDDKRAQADFDKNLKNSSDKGQAWFNYAYALRTAGMLDAAIDADKKAAEFDQYQAMATYNLACAYSLKNEKDNAFDALDKAIEFGFRDAKLISTDTDLKNLRDDDRFDAIVTKIQWGNWYERGLANAKQGKFELAINDLTKAIELNPKYAIAVHQRGQLYQRMGDEENAAANFDQYTAVLDSVVNENPQDWQAVNRRGVAYFNMGNWDAATDDFAQAIELAPDKAVARTNRANCSLNLQQWHKAAEDLVRVIELGEANWQTHFYLALARLGDGDQTAYHKACRTMLAEFSDTEDPLVANFVAWTCSLGPGALEDWTPAIEKARLAKLKNDSLQNQNTLGTLLIRAGQTEEAIKVLKNVTGLLNNPSSSGNASPAYTWYALALAYHDARQTEEAKEWFEKANRWTEKAFNEDESQGGAKLAWNRRLTLQLLRDQANAIFSGNGESINEETTNEGNQSDNQNQSTDSEK